MQNLHRHVSTHGVDIAEDGELFIPAGYGKTSFVDARDVAAVAAEALLDPAVHSDRVHHLTGPVALAMDEVAAALTRHLGRPVRYIRPGVLRFAARLRRRGVGWDSVGFMSAIYTLTRFGRNEPITDELPRILGRAPRTLDDFLVDHAWRFTNRAWT